MVEGQGQHPQKQLLFLAKGCVLMLVLLLQITGLLNIKEKLLFTYAF